MEITSMQGNTLAGCEFTIYNANEKSVVVSGVEAAPGEAALVIVTDENGYAATGDSVLQYGQYQIRETKAPAGYNINNSVTDDDKVEDMYTLQKDSIQYTNIIKNRLVKNGTGRNLSSEERREHGNRFPVW